MQISSLAGPQTDSNQPEACRGRAKAEISWPRESFDWPDGKRTMPLEAIIPPLLLHTSASTIIIFITFVVCGPRNHPACVEPWGRFRAVISS